MAESIKKTIARQSVRIICRDYSLDKLSLGEATFRLMEWHDMDYGEAYSLLLFGTKTED